MSQSLNLDKVLTLTEHLVNAKLKELKFLEALLARTIVRGGSLITQRRTRNKIESIKKMLEPIQPLLDNNGKS